MLKRLLTLLTFLWLLNDGGDGDGNGGDGDDNGDGGDGDGGDGGEGEDDPPAGDSKPDPDELKRVGAAEAKKAARAERKKIADKFGVPLDEAEKIIADHKAAQEKAKDDVTRAKEGQTSAEAERDEALGELRATRLRQAIFEGLLDPGDDAESPLPTLNPRRKDVALTLAMPVALGHDGDDDDEAIAAAIEHVRSNAPEFLSGSSGDGDGDGRGTGTPPPPTRPGKQQSKKKRTGLDRGSDLYKQHTAKTPASVLPSEE